MSLSAECEQSKVAGFFKSNHNYQRNIFSVVIDLFDHSEPTVAVLVDPTSEYIYFTIISTLQFHGDKMWW